MQETWVWSLGWEDPLEKRKPSHSSILAWRILWTVWSMGQQRVGQDWATFTFTGTGLTGQHSVKEDVDTSHIQKWYSKNWLGNQLCTPWGKALVWADLHPCGWAYNRYPAVHIRVKLIILWQSAGQAIEIKCSCKDLLTILKWKC